MRLSPSSTRRRRFVRTATALAAVSLVSCAGTQRPFPLRPAYWVDNDTRPLAHPPEEYWSPLIWDAADHSAFRPLTRAMLVETGHEAVNVNSLDEVPESSWFNTRMELGDVPPELSARGACGDVPPAPDDGTWTVLSAKPNGNTPGFIARGPDGRRYVLKTEGTGAPEQNTTADTVVSRLYWTVGYNTPCYHVVYLHREQLQLAPDAHFQNAYGHDQPMTRAQLDPILRNTTDYPDGRLRFSVSRFVDGRPLGPFRYEGTRPDDPNDVVRHEDRRDLRGAYLLASWFNHSDAREQNTLSVWTPAQGGGGYVKHYMLDFSDCLGQPWSFDAMSRRLGRSGYFDIPVLGADFFSLGLIDRTWDHVHVDPQGWIFGYYTADNYEPDHFRPGYPNPAFDRMTERDGAWMARIIAKVTNEHIHEAVTAARITQPTWSQHLEQVLAVRRDKLLARYLTRLSPLADIATDGDRLCADDRGIRARIYPAAHYDATLIEGEGHGARRMITVESVGSRVCVSLPHGEFGNARDDDPARYRVIEVSVTPEGHPAISPLRAHLYDLGVGRGFALAGLER